MRRISSRLVLMGAFLFGILCGSLGLTVLHGRSSDHVRAQSACDSSTLSGTYGALVSGFILAGPDGAPLAAPVPRFAVNLLTADGAGNITRAGTQNTGGTVSPNTGAGTYTVNADCTFTVTYTSTVLTAHLAGVLVAGGSKAFVISADPKKNAGVTWERQ
ncbi:MAG: hypothetical protein ACYDCQ_09860 [Dehalococcoidia bacterium]